MYVLGPFAENQMMLVPLAPVSSVLFYLSLCLFFLPVPNFSFIVGSSYILELGIVMPPGFFLLFRIG